jgi:hypothetical protein
MSQFWAPDEESTARCHKLCAEGTPDTVSGVDTLDNQVKAFTGVVQCVEDHGEQASSARRWRITMIDSKKDGPKIKLGQKGWS